MNPMTSLGEHPPKNGGRVTLKLKQLDGDRVRYEFSLLTNATTSVGALAVTVEDGLVSFESGQFREEEEWMKELARSLVRAAWRNREQYGWPRRITRWRPEPRMRAT